MLTMKVRKMGYGQIWLLNSGGEVNRALDIFRQMSDEISGPNTVSDIEGLKPKLAPFDVIIFFDKNNDGLSGCLKGEFPEAYQIEVTQDSGGEFLVLRGPALEGGKAFEYVFPLYTNGMGPGCARIMVSSQQLAMLPRFKWEENPSISFVMLTGK